MNARKIKASFNYVCHSQLLINILICKERLQSKWLKHSTEQIAHHNFT